LGSSDQIIQLQNLFETNKKISNEDKISAVKRLFQETGAAEASQKLLQYYTKEAFNILDSLEINLEKKQQLIDFTNHLMQRKD
jgi:geranylgeranyl diphosphate synthase type II